MSTIWQKSFKGANRMQYIMQVETLKSMMETKPEELRIIDTRFELQDPEAGGKAYLQEHIPGAIYMDLNKDLSNPPEVHGGSHPLPDKENFVYKLGKNGICETSTVVIYDEANDMFSARLWWLLHTLGHEKVYVLDGGLQAWKEARYETTTDLPVYIECLYKPKQQQIATVNINEMKEQMKEEGTVLLDSRAKDRYLGKVEPLYKKAGHIPGAKSYFWKGVLDENGRWKDEQALKQHFSSLSKDDRIIVSCGSGVSACPNIIGLKLAGFQHVKLYPGSYSDWISYDDHEVETSDES